MGRFKKRECSEEYKNHLKSKYFKQVQWYVLQRENFKCQLCGAVDSFDEFSDLECHHICGKYRFRELDGLNSMMLLCKEDHDRLHDFFDARDLMREHKNDSVKPSMYPEWEKYVKANQSFVDYYFQVAKAQNGY